MIGVICAIRAEAFRFQRNTSVFFWGFLFVPLVYVVFGIAIDLQMPTGVDQIPKQTDPIRQMIRATSLAGNPIAQLFVAIGAASIFGGDYTQKTWRLLGSRAHRASLMTAKWTVYIGTATAGLLCAMLGSALAMLAIATVNGLPYAAVAQPLSSVAMAASGSILELAVFGTYVAVVAIITRSMLAAVFPAFLLSAGQAFICVYATPPVHVTPWLGLPTFAGDIIRQSVVGVSWGSPPTAGAVALSILSLCCWTLLGFLTTLWLIQRQDWSRE